MIGAHAGRRQPAVKSIERRLRMSKRRAAPG
jgi:hypothetical protein